MADTESITGDSVVNTICTRCGTCQSGEEAVQILSCSKHALCEGCLQSDSMKVVEGQDARSCQDCSFTSSNINEADDLKSPNTTDGKSSDEDDVQSMLCDACNRKGEAEIAVYGCMICSEKYCARHHESHADLLGHETLTIEEYVKEQNLQLLRHCVIHPGQQLIYGCEKCTMMFCCSCVPELKDDCFKGSKHALLTMDKIADSVKTRTSSIVTRFGNKREVVKTSIGKIEEVLDNYDGETGKMVIQIHQARDAQLSGLKKKYEEIEGELLLKRESTMSEMQVIKASLVEFHSQLDAEQQKLLILVADADSYHKVDLMKKYEATINETRAIFNRPFSQKVPFTVALKIKESNMDIDVELEKNVKDVGIPRQLLSLKLPKLQLVSSCSMDGQPSSVCHSSGIIYTATKDGEIFQIDLGPNKIKMRPFMKKFEQVLGIRTYNNKLFTLGPYDVDTVDIQTRAQLQQLSHSDLSYPLGQRKFGNLMALIADQIVLVNREKKEIQKRHWSGQGVPLTPWSEGREVPLPNLGLGIVSICACGEDSVIIADSENSSVAKMGFQEFRSQYSQQPIVEVQEWEVKLKFKPTAVASDGDNVYVTMAEKSNILVVLDSKTGRQQGIIQDTENKFTLSAALDLCIFKDMIIIPRDREKKLYIYKLVY